MRLLHARRIELSILELWLALGWRKFIVTVWVDIVFILQRAGLFVRGLSSDIILRFMRLACIWWGFVAPVRIHILRIDLTLNLKLSWQLLLGEVALSGIILGILKKPYFIWMWKIERLFRRLIKMIDIYIHTLLWCIILFGLIHLLFIILH